jgi:hypothetical protein
VKSVVASNALRIFLGREAARRIELEGWSPDLFGLLLGASGGPKWLILSALDRVLFGDFLQRGERPLSVLGSSIGSWRHACLTTGDPTGTLARLEAEYLAQTYSSKPGPAEVSAISLGMLERALGNQGVIDMLQHPRIGTHIVTARGRGLAATATNPALATGLGMAALGNAVSRRLLTMQFQRVVFHSGASPDPGLALDDFQTAYCRLREDTVKTALHASGAIPLVLMGERDIPGAPAGHYWDGGIIDYHFDLSQYRGDGLILYPHFSASIVIGWFDKFLPWRRSPVHDADKLVLLCPDPGFVASLPYGKIPDRSDFNRLAPEERVRYWKKCIASSTAMAEEFADLVAGGDPLRGATVF